MKRAAQIFISISLLLSSTSALAQAPASGDTSSREFVASCMYGVLAGTLVGAASLAFTKRPGDNLNRVARGASLGLYTGILLGLYVVYIVPGLEKVPDEDPIVRVEKFPLMIAPTLDARANVDGAQAGWKWTF
jgi:hypothetical protein